MQKALKSQPSHLLQLNPLLGRASGCDSLTQSSMRSDLNGTLHSPFLFLRGLKILLS